MKIAYIVLAHTDPGHIARLSRKVTKGTKNHVFIHVDSKVDIIPFENACQDIENVHFVEKRYKVFWAGFNSVTATVESYREALNYSDFDYFHILQGLDYPIKNNSEINDFFEKNNGKEIIRAINETNSAVLKVRFKYTLHWQFDSKNIFHVLHQKYNFAQLLWFKHLFEKKPVYIEENGKRYDIFRGWAHFALTRQATEYCVNFYDTHPAFNEYFKHVYAADESYFHTVIFNSEFAVKTIDGKPIAEEDRSYGAYLNITYFEYPKEGVVLFKDISDYKKLNDSGYLFFRKASSKSKELLDYIDSVHDKAAGRGYEG